MHYPQIGRTSNRAFLAEGPIAHRDVLSSNLPCSTISPVSSAFLPCNLIDQSVNCQPLPWIWSHAAPIACPISQLHHVWNFVLSSSNCALQNDHRVTLNTLFYGTLGYRCLIRSDFNRIFIQPISAMLPLSITSSINYHLFYCSAASIILVSGADACRITSASPHRSSMVTHPPILNIVLHFSGTSEPRQVELHAKCESSVFSPQMYACLQRNISSGAQTQLWLSPLELGYSLQ